MYINTDPNSPMNRMMVPVSICARCANCCGRCSWSAMFVPVKGWDAEPTIINISGVRSITSFLVKSCPMFRSDATRHTRTIRTDRVVPFCMALILSGIRDYSRSLIKVYECERTGKSPNKYARHISTVSQSEWWLRSPFVADMLDVCGIHAEPNALIEAIKADPKGVYERIKQTYRVAGEDDGDDDDYTN